MRPRSILMFERLYAAAVMLGAVAGIAALPRSVATLSALGAPRALAPVSLVIGTAISVALLWLVARRASDVARWVLVGMALLAALLLARSLVRGDYGWGVIGWIGLARMALAAAALSFTFRADARDWLAPAVHARGG